MYKITQELVNKLKAVVQLRSEETLSQSELVRLKELISQLDSLPKEQEQKLWPDRYYIPTRQEGKNFEYYKRLYLNGDFT